MEPLELWLNPPLMCVCVCLEFAAFISHLFPKYDMPLCFSPVFLGIKLDRKPSLPRRSAFNGYY